ncbi:hypothetical protein P170DRAFT_476073 [Aspergillus steynii IBT 23096]|uniref:Uncharacterized protein n=1 Tax=Aspergillus steynii IBT 23096 TaxID=1392250 RepID=A0A2I2GA88_9EURO|nr:uncharacterized protein P170DRAFT_476073 [Aspergillus steynii IBT 23096]PLB49789.1 hypothetical protein P170DRAFT_476073 [Aspergillus steynii IBT 23096]
MPRKWVSVYTGPEPFRYLFDEYCEALKRLLNGHRVLITNHDTSGLHLHLCFSVFITSHQNLDAVDTAVAMIEYLINPRTRNPLDTGSGLPHLLFNDSRYPMRQLTPIEWTDRHVDADRAQNRDRFGEGADDFAFRQARRRATRDLVTYHRDEYGCTSAVLNDNEGEITITNHDPRDGFEYSGSSWRSKGPGPSSVEDHKDRFPLLGWDLPTEDW